MEKILLIGINTREMINSGIKLNFEIYSTSYFHTYDTIEIKNQKYLLKQESNKSCGFFENDFNKNDLLDLSKDYIEEVDYIIPISGVSPSDFKGKYKKKILGNKDIENIENKFKFYKKIKDDFLTPETFRVNSIEQAIEINENSEGKEYILKPVEGSGGYGISFLNKESINQLNNSKSKWIIQEHVNGINLSSSVLGSKEKAKNLINSRLLIENDFKNQKGFKYIGNIMPLDEKSILANLKNTDKLNEKLNNTSETIIEKFKLIGSNGIDYILSEKGLYVLEINPRIQGTYEICEKILNINMLDAHIKACNDILIDVNKKINSYCIKKIIYSDKRLRFTKLNLNNFYDIPYQNVIIEKNQPFLTYIEKNTDFNNLCKNTKIASEKIKNLF